MQERTPTFGLFPIAVCAYGVYYLSDAIDGRFETFGYGALCVSFVFALSLIQLSTVIVRRAEGRPWSSEWRAFVAGAFRLDRTALIVLGSLIAYCIAQIWIGFAAATLCAFAWLLWLLRYRIPVHWAFATLGLSLLSYVALIMILNVPLPDGGFLH